MISNNTITNITGYGLIGLTLIIPATLTKISWDVSILALQAFKTGVFVHSVAILSLWTFTLMLTASMIYSCLAILRITITQDKSPPALWPSEWKRLIPAPHKI